MGPISRDFAIKATASCQHSRGSHGDDPSADRRRARRAAAACRARGALHVWRSHVRPCGTTSDLPRDHGLLEAALARSQASAFGEDAYPTIRTVRRRLTGAATRRPRQLCPAHRARTPLPAPRPTTPTPAAFTPPKHPTSATPAPHTPTGPPADEPITAQTCRCGGFRLSSGPIVAPQAPASASGRAGRRWRGGHRGGRPGR